MFYESTRYKKYDFLPPNAAWEKLLKQVKPGSTVLELGCYEGEMSRILKEKYRCLVFGIEINEKAAQKARKYVDQLIVGDMEAIDLSEHFKGKRFDTFIFADILEHLSEPDSFLKKARSFLNDDGFILASIPNVAYSGIVFDLLQGEFNYSKEGLLDRSHLRFFTKEEIYFLFERTGFYVSHLDRVMSEFPQYSEFHTDLNRYSPDIVAEILKNRENLTYQFIVRAEKTSEANLINFLKIKNRLLKMRLRELTSSGKIFSEIDIQEKLAQKDKELYERDRLIQDRERKIYELGTELQKSDKAIGQKDKELFERDQVIQDRERKIYELGTELQDKDKTVAQKDKELSERDQVIQDWERKIYELGLQLQESDKAIGQKDKELSERDQVIQDWERKIYELGAELQDKDKTVAQKDKELYERDRVIQDRERKIYELGLQLQESDKAIGQKDKELYERDQVIQDREQKIYELGLQLQERDKAIGQRNNEIDKLNLIIKSRRWWEFWK
jgi:2-polyprenyl-3-methyl-5-hydroxy-6-metoxy-1,4-benzoquinol methylase